MAILSLISKYNYPLWIEPSSNSNLLAT